MGKKEMAFVCKALSDINRLDILDLLKHGEQCACHLLDYLNISQSTLSYHMKILSDANIVNIRKDGKWSYYSIHKEGCQKAMKFISNLYEANICSTNCDCE